MRSPIPFALLLGAALVLPRTSRAAGDVVDTAESPNPWLDRLASHGYSGAVLAIEDDEVVVEQAFGYADVAAGRRMTTNSVFDVGSITKQFTAAAILALVADGKLAVTDKLSK